MDDAKLAALLKRLGPDFTDPATEGSPFEGLWDPARGWGDDVTQEQIDLITERMFVAAEASARRPIPAVTIEEFFDGNDDPGSMQVARFEEMPRILTAIRSREEVADLRIGVTQWDGEGTWPLGEYLFIVTSADAETAMGWLLAAGIRADEYGIGDEHRPREPIPVPEGMQVVWIWFD